jgi:hypothetical protein
MLSMQDSTYVKDFNMKLLDNGTNGGGFGDDERLGLKTTF